MLVSSPHTHWTRGQCWWVLFHVAVAHYKGDAWTQALSPLPLPRHLNSSKVETSEW